MPTATKKKTTETTFNVKFNNVGRYKKSWEQRISRPVTNEKIIAAVKKAKVLASRAVDAESTSDYGGIILAGDRPAGDYLIEPGSEA